MHQHRNLRMESKDMEQAIIRNLPNKTGKTLEQWIGILNGFGPPGRSERIAWLINAHHMGRFQARVIAAHAGRNADGESDFAHAEALFSSVTENVLAIYGLILRYLRSLGTDVRAIPSGKYISFFRSTPFLALRPTATGLIVGLHLESNCSNARLAPSSDFDSNSIITHQISLNSPLDMDNVVTGFIKTAYNSA